MPHVSGFTIWSSMGALRHPNVHLIMPVALTVQAETSSSHNNRDIKQHYRPIVIMINICFLNMPVILTICSTTILSYLLHQSAEESYVDLFHLNSGSN